MGQGGLLRVSASSVAEDTTLGDELVRRIAAAKKGDTVVLEKVSAFPEENVFLQ
jgi:hypothetical protein